MLWIIELFRLEKTLKIITSNHKAVASSKGYTIWMKKSVNINGYPLWGHTFAHRVGYHTKSVERPGQELSPMREKRKQTKKSDSNHTFKQSKGLPGLTPSKKKLGRQHCKLWIEEKGQAEDKTCFCSTVCGNLNYQNSATVIEELNLLFQEYSLPGPHPRHCSWNIKMVQPGFDFIYLYTNPSKLSQRAGARWPAWDKAGKLVTVLDILWLGTVSALHQSEHLRHPAAQRDLRGYTRNCRQSAHSEGLQ